LQHRRPRWLEHRHQEVLRPGLRHHHGHREEQRRLDHGQVVTAQLAADPVPQSEAPGRRLPGNLARNGGLSLVTTYLSLVVLLPLAAVIWRSQSGGWGHFWHQVHQPEAWSAVKLTL